MVYDDGVSSHVLAIYCASVELKKEKESSMEGVFRGVYVDHRKRISQHPPTRNERHT